MVSAWISLRSDAEARNPGWRRWEPHLTVDHEPETGRGVGGIPIEVSRFQCYAAVFISLVPIVIVVLRMENHQH
jgi:hypothetical protein